MKLKAIILRGFSFFKMLITYAYHAGVSIGYELAKRLDMAFTHLNSRNNSIKH